MLAEKLERFLRNHKVYYQIYVGAEMPPFCSPLDIKKMAKTVIVRTNGKPLMVVIPASEELDLKELGIFLKRKDVQIEKECACRELLPECEPEAVPPFGQLYKLPCVVDQGLQDAEKIIFKEGSEGVHVEIEAADFFKVLKGRIGNFTAKDMKTVGV